MIRLIGHWFLSAFCILVVARLIPGFVVAGFGTALIAAIVIGLINGTLGLFLKLITLPFTLLTFGVFWFVINALMLKLAAVFVHGFEVHGWWPAFFGGLILSFLNLTLRALLPKTTES